MLYNCELYFITIKEREEETEKKHGIPPLIRSLYYMEVIKERKAEAGNPAEGLRIFQKKIKKSIKKVLTKARKFDTIEVG